MSVNSSSLWSPTDYAANAAFVPALGGPALELLDPQPGELILDIGCGDGILTRRIMDAGARAIGLDASPGMVEAARARGVDAFVADAQALDLESQASRFGLGAYHTLIGSLQLLPDWRGHLAKAEHLLRQNINDEPDAAVQHFYL